MRTTRLVSAWLLVFATALGAAEPAAAALLSPELACRATLAQHTRRYVERVHRARHRCLRAVFKGKLSPLTDCIEGLGDTQMENRLEVLRAKVGANLPRACLGADLNLLGFPGRCPVQNGSPFDVFQLEICLLRVLDGAVADMLRVQTPPVAALPPGSLPCVRGVGIHGLAMVRKEVLARERCLLIEERDQFIFDEPLTCRDPLPPYGVGTGLAEQDRIIRNGYVDVLAGVPQVCRATRLDRLGFNDDCEDLTGGRFSTFDYKLCVFENHRQAVENIMDSAFPRPADCGNGEVEGEEQCDDGNQVDTDACLNDCTTARCGDGQTRLGVEECDDGNTNQADACLNDCKAARCGDGQTRIGVEDCDDGNTVQTDPCLNDCTRAACGDGFECEALQPVRCTSGPENGPELCDDGNTASGDGCSAGCALEFCGDGVTQAGLGEQCDEGGGNSNTAPDACRGDCKSARCGDGVVDSGETCDPPDATACAENCTALLCGNGDLDEGEDCDDGAANSDTAPDACRTTCTLPRCGDGVRDPSLTEACDDGNASDEDGCRNDCKANTCGDGFRNPAAEQCDDGNTLNTDACIACNNATCGDGFVRAGVETCDDGNANSNDPCVACKAAACGDGSVCSAGGCTTGPEGGPEQCDAGAANSDTAGDACRTSCALPGCGDGVVDDGEECDGAAGACTDGGCGGACKCANECPGSGELMILAGDGPPCTGDGQCPAGACIEGRCRTGSRLDTGMTGLAHGADITDRVIARGFLDCGASFPCGVCEVTGLDPSNGMCRCANDNRAVCDEPFVADGDDCGGETCNCYFGPPLALSSGNTPACVVNRFSEDVSGTANVDLGEGEITTLLRATVFLGEGKAEPCPYCTGDAVENDGVRDGTCMLGLDAGKDCDVHGFNTTFPAPNGDGHSLDCFPSAGKNVSGQGLRIDLTQKTGRSELAISGDVICGFPHIPALRIPCWCLQCSGDPSVSCTSHAECAALGIGQCTSTASAALPSRINECQQTCSPVDEGGVLGQCEPGPDDRYCDGALRASGEGYVGCLTNADCEEEDYGACMLIQRRACFLNPIVAEGHPDPATPIGAATFCVPPTSNPAINTVAGIPGPARVFTQARSTLFCAADPTKIYTPGVGGCAEE